MRFLPLLELSELEGLDDTQDSLADSSSFILLSMLLNLALNSENFESIFIAANATQIVFVVFFLNIFSIVK